MSKEVTLSELTKADIDRAVMYQAQHDGRLIGEPERGLISSWNDRYVFVRFGFTLNGQAVDPRFLEFEHG